jgi:DNA-binding MarR family transcriptional regulator
MLNDGECVNILGDCLTFKVWLIGHRLELKLDHVLHQCGLTARQFSALVRIAGDPLVSRAGLARSLGTTPQAVGGLTQRLYRSGMIDRTTPEPGSPVTYTVTVRGQKQLARATALVAEVELSQLRELRPETAQAVTESIFTLLSLVS